MFWEMPRLGSLFLICCSFVFSANHDLTFREVRPALEILVLVVLSLISESKDERILDQCESHPSDDSMSDTDTTHAICTATDMEEEVQVLERKLFLRKSQLMLQRRDVSFWTGTSDFFKINEISLQRQRSACEMDLAELN
ncbi:uncharacterized protein LOC144641734 isoform X2 [Oculina patagonica]